MLTTIAISIKIVSVFLSLTYFIKRLSSSTKDLICYAIGIAWGVCVLLDLIRGIQLFIESENILAPVLYVIILGLDIFNAYSYLKNSAKEIKKKCEDLEISRNEDPEDLNRLI